MTDRYIDRYIIEVRGAGGDWTYPDCPGMEVAESMDRAVSQVLALVDEVEEIRVTRLNDETPARDMSEDVLSLAFLEWDGTHDCGHSVPPALQAAYDASNILRVAV